MTFSYSLGILNCLCHSPVNFSKGSMESFFACAHFCPIYGEVTLQCQNFTFMNGSDVNWGGRVVKSDMHTVCIIFIFYSLTLLSNMCPVYWLHFNADCCIIFLAYTSCLLQVVLFIAFPVFILQTTALGFPCCTHRLLVDMCFISFILAHLLLLSWI